MQSSDLNVETTLSIVLMWGGTMLASKSICYRPREHDGQIKSTLFMDRLEGSHMTQEV